MASNGDCAVGIIEWVLNAVRPLKAVELREALAVRSRDTIFCENRMTFRWAIVDVCEGLVETDLKTDELRFVLPGARDYILKHGLPNRADIYPTITRTCILYLLLEDLNIAPEDEEAYKAVREKRKFLAYAATFWGDHVQESTGEEDILLTKKLLRSKNHISLAWRVYWEEKEARNDPTAVVIRRAGWRCLQSTHPLVIASGLGLETFVRWILANDVDKLRNTDFGVTTPLHMAAMTGNVKIIDILLDFGVDDNGRSGGGCTAPLNG